MKPALIKFHLRFFCHKKFLSNDSSICFGSQSGQVRLYFGEIILKRIDPALNHVVVLHLEAEDHASLLFKDTFVAFRDLMPFESHFFVKLLYCGVKQEIHVVKNRLCLFLGHAFLKFFKLVDRCFFCTDLLDDFIKAFEPVFESFDKEVRPVDLVFILQLLLIAHLFSVSAEHMVENELPNRILKVNNLFLLRKPLSLVL